MSTAHLPSAPGREHPAAVLPLHPAGRRSHEAAASHVDETPWHYRLRVAVALVIVAGIALVDVIVIKTTWNQVLLDHEIVSWLLAISTALGGTAAMWTSGKLVAAARIFSNAVKMAAAVAAVTGWTALGAGLFWLRWNAARLAVTDVTVEGQSTDNSAAHTHQLMAVVMITLYVVPGVLAWIDGYLLGNPVAAHQRRSAATLRKLDKKVHDTEAEGTQVNRVLAMHHEEIRRIDESADNAKRANTALADELMAHVRAEILRRIGDPAAGGMTHPEEQPRPPAPPEGRS